MRLVNMNIEYEYECEYCEYVISFCLTEQNHCIAHDAYPRSL